MSSQGTGENRRDQVPGAKSRENPRGGDGSQTSTEKVKRVYMMERKGEESHGRERKAKSCQPSRRLRSMLHCGVGIR